MCLLIAVLAVLLALPGLFRSLPRPEALFLGVVYGLIFVFVWMFYLVLSAVWLFTYMFSKPQQWPSAWPWVRTTVVAALTLVPFFVAATQEYQLRQLPNGYRVTSGMYPHIEDAQGAPAIPGTVERWEVQGDIVLGELKSGMPFEVDTQTGESWLGEP